MIVASMNFIVCDFHDPLLCATIEIILSLPNRQATNTRFVCVDGLLDHDVRRRQGCALRQAVQQWHLPLLIAFGIVVPRRKGLGRRYEITEKNRHS